MPEQKTKLFAIISTPFSRQDTGRVTPHIWGAIFDVDAQGVATDFTAIDFDGKSVRRWERDNFGKANPIRDHLAGLEHALFFPISESSAALMKEAVEEVAMRARSGMRSVHTDPTRSDDSACESDNPFYFGSKARQNEMLERHGRMPVDFSGKPIDVSHAERLSYQRAAHARPRAATNCMTFLQEVLEKIGGVPLDGFVTPEGEAMPRDGDPFRMDAYLHALSGNKNKMYNERKAGRLLKLPDGRKAYAYDRTDCCGSVTYALNSQPSQHDALGNPVPLTQYLLAQPPFYNPALNENDLGRNMKPMAGGINR